LGRTVVRSRKGEERTRTNPEAREEKAEQRGKKGVERNYERNRTRREEKISLQELEGRETKTIQKKSREERLENRPKIQTLLKKTAKVL